MLVAFWSSGKGVLDLSNATLLFKKEDEKVYYPTPGYLST